MKKSQHHIIGIIGGKGKMGAYFARLFKDAGYKVLIADRGTRLTNTRLTNKELAQKADVVIISVPISATRAVMKEVVPHVKKSGVIVDLTSIKEIPVKEMLKGESQVIGLHPMFGPTNPLAGQTIIACPARGKTHYQWLKKFLTERGAKVVEMTPREHDKTMAIVQGMVHFADIAFAHALKELKVPVKKYLQFASPASELKIAFAGRILAQNPQLYASIELENPQALRAIMQYAKSIQKLAVINQKKDSKAFEKYFTSAGRALKTYKSAAQSDTNYLIHAILQRRRRAREVGKKNKASQKSDIAVLGPAKTFSDIAAQTYAKPDKTIMRVASIHAVFEALEEERAKTGIVPIENMLNGTVRETYDELFHRDMSITTKINIPIHHALVALPGVKKSDIDTITSHPQAIAQCSSYLQKNFPQARRKAAPSTIQAFETMQGEDDRGSAAIVPQQIARQLACDVIAPNIGDRKDNQTTFAVIQKGKALPPQKNQEPQETSLAFAFAQNKPGSLSGVFQEFARANINLSRIESRPSKTVFGEYVFFLDFEASPVDPAAKKALTNIKKMVKMLKILGTYTKPQ